MTIPMVPISASGTRWPGHVHCGQESTPRPLGLIATHSYAHAKAAHGDIKAANILLDSRAHLPDRSASPVARTDSAVLADPKSTAVRNSAATRPKLRRLYRRARGQLISGTPPEPRRPISLLGPDGSAVPPALDVLVNRMLSADAAERPDASSVAAALDAAGFPAGHARIVALIDEPESIQSIVPAVLRKEQKPATPGVQDRKEGLGVSANGGRRPGCPVAADWQIFLLPEATDDSKVARPTATSADIAGDAEQADDAGIG
jgi:hypothetical protein